MELIYLIVAGVLVIWNVCTFIMYAVDKSRAKNNKWRISEATLIAVAFLLGGIGALLGMHVLRHKTQHVKFKVCVPLAVVINIAVIVAIFVLV